MNLSLFPLLREMKLEFTYIYNVAVSTNKPKKMVLLMRVYTDKPEVCSNGFIRGSRPIDELFNLSWPNTHTRS